MLESVYAWIRSLTPKTQRRMSREDLSNVPNINRGRKHFTSHSDSNLNIAKKPFHMYRSASDSNLIVVKPKLRQVSAAELLDHMKQTAIHEDNERFETFFHNGRRCKGDRRLSIY